MSELLTLLIPLGVLFYVVIVILLAVAVVRDLRESRAMRRQLPARERHAALRRLQGPER